VKNVRAQVIIQGIVQGVFFRANTRQEAQARGVTGWVKNRPDGAVEALFEGPEDQVQAMVAWCHQGPAYSRVDQVSVSWEEYEGSFSRFSIIR